MFYTVCTNVMKQFVCFDIAMNTDEIYKLAPSKQVFHKVFKKQIELFVSFGIIINNDKI